MFSCTSESVIFSPCLLLSHFLVTWYKLRDNSYTFLGKNFNWVDHWFLVQVFKILTQILHLFSMFFGNLVLPKISRSPFYQYFRQKKGKTDRQTDRQSYMGRGIERREREKQRQREEEREREREREIKMERYNWTS